MKFLVSLVMTLMLAPAAFADQSSERTIEQVKAELVALAQSYQGPR